MRTIAEQIFFGAIIELVSLMLSYIFREKPRTAIVVFSVGTLVAGYVAFIPPPQPDPHDTPTLSNASTEPATTISPTEAPQKSTIAYGRLTYENDFDSAQDIQGWDTGGVRVEGGNLIMNSETDLVPFYSVDPPVFSNFIFEAQFSFRADSSWLEFIVRFQYPPCVGWNCGIVIPIDRTTNSLYAYRREGGENQTQVSFSQFNPEHIQFLPEQSNKINIIVNGSSYKVYLNDYAVMEFDDNKYQSGTFILYNGKPGEIKVDYIRVYDLP